MSDIRVAMINDAEAIALVHVNSWKETYRGLMPVHVLDGLSVEQRTLVWSNRLNDPHDPYHRVLVAEAKGRTVAFASYGKELTNDPDHQGELFAIYVLKEFQGQGIGASLVRNVVDGLQGLNITSMLVWVLADNPYRKFYERLGGVFLREKVIELGGASLKEKAYGWSNVRTMIG